MNEAGYAPYQKDGPTVHLGGRRIADSVGNRQGPILAVGRVEVMKRQNQKKMSS